MKIRVVEPEIRDPVEISYCLVPQSTLWILLNLGLLVVLQCLQSSLFALMNERKLRQQRLKLLFRSGNNNNTVISVLFHYDIRWNKLEAYENYEFVLVSLLFFSIYY